MNAPAVTIRPAQAADANAVAALSKQLGYEAAPDAVAARLTRFLERRDQQFLVADQDGQVVGWIHVLVQEYVEAEPSRPSIRSRSRLVGQGPAHSAPLFPT